MNENYCIFCMEKTYSSGDACLKCRNLPEYVSPIHHIKPGTILRGKYLIGRALGEGGFGITYVGRDLTLDMRIAVKEFYPNGYSNRNHNHSNVITMSNHTSEQNFEKDMQRFLNEARTLAKFANEPGIVGVRDFFRDNGTAYIVMEYLDGITLRDYIKEYGPIPPERLFNMMAPVMLSLERIHSEGMIHRDISPDNIMLLRNGQLKLLDFGAAREITNEKSLSVVLKHGYAPEEQYRSKGNQGPWTDVYALSATMYKCLTGITPMQSLERVYSDELQPPSVLGIEISQQYERTLLQGLSVRIGDRPQSIKQLYDGWLSKSRDEAVRNITFSMQFEEMQHSTAHQIVAEDDTATLYENKETAEALTSRTVRDSIPISESKNQGDIQEKDESVQATNVQEISKDTLSSSQRKRNLKDRKNRTQTYVKFAVFASGIILAVVVGLVSIYLFLKEPQPDLGDLIPNERAMASDCSTVLKRNNIPGSVLDLNIQNEQMNEKFKTLVVTCDVSVWEENVEKYYVVDLYYEYEDDSWVLGNMSKIKE